MRKLSLNYVNNSFEREGYSLISEEYVNSKAKLHYICPNNHKHSISWKGWTQGQRCPICAGVSKPNIEYVRECMLKCGYTLLSSEYVNAKSKLLVRCPKGHNFEISWSNWSNKTRSRRCPYCCKRPPISLDTVIRNVKDNGYKLISNAYINAKNKLHLVCSSGHDYYVNWDNWHNKGNRCPKCSGTGTSFSEKLLLDFIRTIYSGTIVENDRSLISPYELDIVIPEKKIAIEYCGLYWHSDLMGKGRKYHLRKLDMCNLIGYSLITIFEDELLLNKDIVLSVLKNKLGIGGDIKIYARKCFVKDIDVKTAKDFCISNHLQGYAGSSIRLGLFNDNNLVSVMTFSKPSISKGAKVGETSVWEISRFCNKKYYSVVGGASKLLKHFENNFNWSEIFSYADRRWSEGNLYYNLSFLLTGKTDPNYWYFSMATYPRRRHRFGLRKTPDMKSGTEWDNRVLEGYNRIWDCGNLKFVKRGDNTCL